MHYTRLAIVVIFLVAIVFWLRQCTSTDVSPAEQATLDNLKSQAGAMTQTQTNAPPAAATTQTQKPATGFSPRTLSFFSSICAICVIRGSILQAQSSLRQLNCIDNQRFKK
jgi:hypothetical protein